MAETNIPEDMLSSLNEYLEAGLINTKQAEEITSVLQSSPRIDQEVIENISAQVQLSVLELRAILNWPEQAAEIEILADDEIVPLKTIIEQMVAEGEFIGSGELADVYRGIEDGERQLCTKKIARTTAKTPYSNSIEQETNIQQQAFRILRTASEKQSIMAKAPKPILYVKTDDESKYLAMEFIKGKTLWRLILEQIVKTTSLSAQYRMEDLLEVDDTDLEEAILDILNLRKLPTREQYKQIIQKAQKTGFLDWKVFEQINNGIKALNNEDLFHRDLHVKNIMISPDGQTYIIDFGSSLHGKTDDPYTTEKFGEQLRYTPDDSILSLLRSICKKSEAAADREINIADTRDKKAADRLIKSLKARANIDLEQIINNAEKSTSSNREFVDKIMEGLKMLMAKMLGLDMLVKIIKIISNAEKAAYGTTDATKRYFLEMALKQNNIPLQNKLQEIL